MGHRGGGRQAPGLARKELIRSELARRAEEAVSRSRQLQAAMTAAAMLAADTEEQVARTLARLATQRPRDARHLLSMSQAAAHQAARERQRAAGLSGGPPGEG